MCINALMKALIRAFKIAVVPAERPASQTRDARAGTPAATCRGRDGSRLFAPVACLRRLRRSAGTTLWGRVTLRPNLVLALLCQKTRNSLGLMVRSRAHPISGLPEIGRLKCPSRLKPTWVRGVSNHEGKAQSPSFETAA